MFPQVSWFKSTCPNIFSYVIIHDWVESILLAWVRDLSLLDWDRSWVELSISQWHHLVQKLIILLLYCCCPVFKHFVSKFIVWTSGWRGRYAFFKWSFSFYFWLWRGRHSPWRRNISFFNEFRTSIICRLSLLRWLNKRLSWFFSWDLLYRRFLFVTNIGSIQSLCLYILLYLLWLWLLDHRWFALLNWLSERSCCCYLNSLRDHCLSHNPRPYFLLSSWPCDSCKSILSVNFRRCRISIFSILNLALLFFGISCVCSSFKIFNASDSFSLFVKTELYFHLRRNLSSSWSSRLLALSVNLNIDWLF